MAFTKWTVTGNIGAGFSAETAAVLKFESAWAEPSQPAMANSSGNQVSLGRFPITVDTAGHFTVDLADTNQVGGPAGWYINIRYSQPPRYSNLVTQRFGPFELTANREFAAILNNGLLTLVPVSEAVLQQVYTARDEAVAVGNTNDTIIASRINDTASATHGALTATFAQLVGPSNGVDDTSWLNAKFATAGSYRLNPGEDYRISGPLVLRSNTTLDMTDATLIGAAGWAGSNMITNYAVANPQRTVADAALTAGSTTLTSASAAFTSADVGRSVVLPVGNLGATSVFTATIRAVTNGTTVTLSNAPTVTVAGAAMSIYTRDKNITVLGGGTGMLVRSVGAPTDNGQKNSIYFRRLDGLDLQGLRHVSTNAKFNISLGDVTDFDIGFHHFECSSDGVHLLGPMNGGRIHDLTGYTDDDFVAIGCSDYTNFADIQGNISNIRVDNLRPMKATSAGAAVHIFAGSTGAPLKVDGISGRGFYGTTVNNYFKLETGDVAGSFSSVDNLLFEDVAPESTSNNPTVLIQGVHGNITIKNLRKSVAETTDIVRVIAGATVRRLVLDGVTILGAPATTGVAFIQTGGTVNTLSIKNPDIALGASGHVVRLAGSLSTLFMEGGAIAGAGSSMVVTCSASQTLKIVARSLKFTGFSDFMWTLWGAITMDLFGVDHGPVWMTMSAGSAGTTVRVRGAAIDTGNAPSPLGGTAGALIYSSTFDLRTDISHATIGKVLGDRWTNTNASLSCGAGPVVCTGTGAAPNWKNLLTGLTY